MSEYQSQPPREPVSGWATAGIAFAAVLMMVVGIFEAIAGLAAIFENEFFVVTPNYVFEADVTAWGWIHLILGIVVALAGFALFYGAAWARVTGIYETTRVVLIRALREERPANEVADEIAAARIAAARATPAAEMRRAS